ncbi:hypothetical protein [Cupriavidus sp. D39]|uniref:hypothetical protein n=1 Tax=Cupriavidus sp. D39 TaxID=2997877 RepID=UPI00226DAB06|nr:hypothetical protein [Cupriavidus sp. D39]MCY0852755.1 hypothetical protein [Cupriavidus sp. D39]
MKIPARTLRMTCVAAALAAATGGASALNTGGFMRVATDTTTAAPPNWSLACRAASRVTATSSLRTPLK